MPEVFATWPVSALDGNNLPTSFTGAILSTTTSITGLTNGTAYRTFVLQNPSPSFTPAAASLSYTFGGNTYFGTTTTSGSAILTVTSGAARKLIIESHADDGFDSVTFNGTTFSTFLVNIGGTFENLRVIVVDVPAGVGGDVTINKTSDITRLRIKYGYVPASATIQAAITTSSSTNNATLDVSQTVAAGSLVLVGVCMGDGTGSGTRAVNWSGATTDQSWTKDLFTWTAWFRKEGLSAGTETITSTNTGESGSDTKTMYSIEVLI